MALEQVLVTVGGQSFSTWTRLHVAASVKEAARSFALELVDTAGAPQAGAVFFGGPELTVTATGELVFTGYVDKVCPRIDGRRYVVHVAARSKGQDMIDSSVDHTKPDYVARTVLDVAQDQDRFGIGFSCDFSPAGFDRWRPNVGDTLFNALRPLCEDEGATMAGEADGSVKITRAGASPERQAGYLQEGLAGLGGIDAGEASFDLSGQHSEVQVHGQSYQGTESGENLAIVGQATNDNVGRTRPVIEHHDRQTSKDRLKRRAKRRRDKEQGEGTRAVIVVRGWRDMGGNLWTPGKTVFVAAPSLYLAQTLLVEGVVYAQGGEERQGTFATLHLVDPRAHGGTGAGGANESGSAWGFDDSAAD